MPTICLRPTTLRLLPSIALSIILFASAASADATFRIDFTPTAGTMAGTVSFANLGDLTPTALSFSNGAECVYNFADPQLIPPEASWSGNQLIGLSLFIRDDSPPCGDFTTFIVVPSGSYTNGVHGAGNYAIGPIAQAKVDVVFSNPVINSGALSFGLSALPANPTATIDVGQGTPVGGGSTSYGLGDVVSANLVFGDGNYAILEAFGMVVLANGSISSLSYTFASINTPTVADGIIILNSPLHISGTDIASGNAFSYTYADSSETFAPNAASVPALSTPGLASLLLLFLSLGSWLAMKRRSALGRV